MDEICDGGMCIFSGDYENEGEVLCDLQAVFFAFDSDRITPHAQEMPCPPFCNSNQSAVTIGTITAVKCSEITSRA